MTQQQQHLKLLFAAFAGLAALAVFLFFRGGESKQQTREVPVIPGSGAQYTGSDAENMFQRREISFAAPDGYALSGTYWIPNAAKRHPALILSHQFNSTRHDYDSFVPVLLKNGYAVFAYDTRGFGKSRNGSADIRDFSKDVIGAVAFLKTREETDSSRIGIIGASVGANVALVASGAVAGIRTAVLLSPSDTRSRGDILLGKDVAHFLPHDLFVASDDREKADADFIVSLVSGRREQKVYPGFGHGVGLLRSETAQADILIFLKSVLGAP